MGLAESARINILKNSFGMTSVDAAPFSNPPKGKQMKSLLISMVATAGLMVSINSFAAELPDFAKKKCGT